jgi:hypothetical protein
MRALVVLCGALAAMTPHEVFTEILVVLDLRASTRGLA